VALEELEGILPAPLSVEDAVAGKELSALLDRFLEGLDKKSRIMFLRRYWFGDPVSLIAARFSMRPNAVSVQLLRIRSKLRVFLEKEGYAV
jgi:RNA polymerase sigma-70 factor (ECF subfamily)